MSENGSIELDGHNTGLESIPGIVMILRSLISEYVPFLRL